ncbi:B3 domain-containing protein At2g33720-like [Lycium barbarum]|uniref:B3 domain-containing protein At2g33720-like n=1 Tax=Lycium barbarum TaxID=112863 RepID=UPI00293E8B4D|nr:B3 domain-containing protein At2g33720-like [Lycium barbarum]
MTFLYDFFPSKAEEEACKLNNTPWIVTMPENKPLMTTKKTFFYNFFKSRIDEEACQFKNTPWIVARRRIIEIRDMYPPPKIDLKTPWQIKKKITRDEFALKRLVIPFFETFEYVVRNWKRFDVQSLVNGVGRGVSIWDVTEKNDPKMTRVSFKKQLCNDDYFLSCMVLFDDRGLSVGDKIGLYWDPRSSSFMFKLFSQAGELLNSMGSNN